MVEKLPVKFTISPWSESHGLIDTNDKLHEALQSFITPALDQYSPRVEEALLISFAHSSKSSRDGLESYAGGKATHFLKRPLRRWGLLIGLAVVENAPCIELVSVMLVQRSNMASYFRGGVRMRRKGISEGIPRFKKH